MEEVFGLVKCKVGEASSREQPSAPQGSSVGARAAGGTADDKSGFGPRFEGEDMGLPLEQFAAEVDNRLAAEREQLLAQDALATASNTKDASPGAAWAPRRAMD